MNKLCIILSLLFIIPATYAFFDKDIRVLTMQNGLADNTVYCIHKDRDGFMWFGTNNGLSRYDGKVIRNFSLADRYLSVAHIRETSDNLLWLLTSNNLMCFNRRTEQLIPVTTDRSWKEVVFMNDSTLWVLSARSLAHLRIEYKQDKEGHISGIDLKLLSETDSLGQDGATLGALCRSDDGLLFIATSNGDLVRFDPIDSRVLNRQKLLNGKDLEIHRMLYNEGKLWLSTIAHGGIVYDPVTGRFRQYTYHQQLTNTSISHHDIYQTIALSDGRLLAATWNGYTVLKPEKDDPIAFTTEIYNNTTSQTLRNMESRMISAYYDPAGMLWVGTRGGGVYASDLRLQFYGRYHQDTHNEICSMVADKEGHLWLAGFHKGVMRSREPFNPLENIHFEPVAAQAGSTVLTVISDSRGNLWFAGRNRMLTCYRADSRTYISYPVQPKGKNTWTGEVWALYMDEKDDIWLGTTDGLLFFDQQSKEFTICNDALGTVRSIVKGAEGTLWLGTTYGLVRFSTDGQKVIGDAFEVRSLLAASDNYLYIGYSGGLGVMSLATEEIEHFYTTRDGLCSNFIGCLVEDEAGDIWLGSNSGITRFSRSQQLFYNYYISGSNRSALLYNSYLFWGNNLNLTYFNPENVKMLHDTPDRVRITQLEVDNKPVEIGKAINNQVILNQGTAYTHQIALNQQNNSFSLSFSNLTFSEELQKYAYRLTPYQPDWLVVNEGEKATYANLLKGDYLFEVRSIFPDGTHGETSSLQITVLPHWYETLLARSVFFIVLLSLFVWIFSWIKRKQERLAKEERLKHELELTNLEREKEKQIHQERENFFTNVSHELRTPLTLIISPLQELLQSGQATAVQEKLELMYGNATSLSTLMNQLLYVQKIEAGMVELHISETDIIRLVRKVMDSFRPLASLKAIDYRWESQEQELRLWMDVGKIESAVRNLLSNALKYTPNGQEITVSVVRRLIDEQPFCLISVSDTGPGIAEDMQSKVFESFITGPANPSFSTKMGIGLRIVKHTMDLHHGKVLLDSEPGKGATFTLYLPEGREHFRSDEYDLAKHKPEEEYQTTASAPASSEAVPVKSSARRLLIIEDNGEMRAYIRSLFDREYRILEAENGKVGVEMAAKELPDLIISDIMMPVMDGFTACQQLKQQLHTAHIPIIMLTAKAADADVLKSLHLGVDDYLMKPFNPEVLKAKVESLILSREQLKRIYTKTLLLQQTGEPLPGEEEKERFMERLVQIVELNLLHPGFSAKVLAENLNLSQPTLYRKVKQYTGLSIIEVIRSIRISKAASLIMQKKYTIQEVCELVGYNDINTFRKHFTNQFGVSPSKYISSGV